MTVLPKRHRVSNLSLKEISSVDIPAQTGAVAVLMKSAGASDVEIRKNAASVAGGDSPGYGSDAFEDAMMRRADELAHYHHISSEQALLKGLAEDTDLRNLAHACEVAKVAEYGNNIRKRRGGSES